MILAATDWTKILTALIAALPAIIAAVYAGRIHSQIKTPSGKSLGQVTEYAHDTVIANNMLLAQQNGPTKQAESGVLKHESETPPRIPSDQPPPPPPEP